MLAICRDCHGCQNVHLRRGRRIRDATCHRCGTRNLGAAHALAPLEFREAGNAWCFAWGAEAATLGADRAADVTLLPHFLAAWYAGYDYAKNPPKLIGEQVLAERQMRSPS